VAISTLIDRLANGGFRGFVVKSAVERPHASRLEGA
jgi:hypothetical protein